MERPLLTLAQVGKLLGITTGKVQHLLLKNFKEASVPRFSLQPPKLCAKPVGATKVTLATITDEEAAYIISPENQQAWAHAGQKVRCMLFHRRFPDRRIGLAVLRKVMQQAGMKVKAIRTVKIPRQRTLRIGELEEKTLALYD